MVDVSEGVQPACRMLGAGFVKLRQRGSLCRRKLRRGDTLLPRRTHVSEGKDVSPCTRIRPEGGDVQVRWVAGARPDRPRRGRCEWPGAGKRGKPKLFKIIENDALILSNLFAEFVA